jgi:hypothetical protein
MTYKILFFILSLIIVNKNQINAQTYYNPRDEINITLTIKEPYKQINYYEIGNNLNNTLQAEIARREALKRYYESIYYSTKNEVQRGTYLTNENNIDLKILLLQDETLKGINRLYNLLTSGMIQPQAYESQIQNMYYNYYRDNQLFLNLCRYKFLKINSLQSDSSKRKFNEDFSFALNSISSINVQNSKTEFTVIGISESLTSTETRNISSIQQYVSNACDGNIEIYKANWANKLAIQQQKENDARNFNKEWAKMSSGIFEARNEKLKNLEYHERLDYLKKERKFLNLMIGESFMEYYFGKGRKFITSIDSNGAIFIDMSDAQIEKIDPRSKPNLFYKYMSEYCGCGIYNSSIFER